MPPPTRLLQRMHGANGGCGVVISTALAGVLEAERACLLEQRDYGISPLAKPIDLRTRAWSTSVRASGMSPDMAAPMCESTSMIFSTL